MDSFLNLFVSLRIFLTLPLLVTSYETRLDGLVLMAIENDILNEMDTDAIIRDFAKLKARKVSLYHGFLSNN